MKRMLIWLFASVLVFTLVFFGVSCKQVAVETTVAGTTVAETTAAGETTAAETTAAETTAAGPKTGGVIKIGILGEAVSLDYSMDNLWLSWVSGRPMNDFLLTMKRDLSFEPRLATEWKISDDGLSIDMTLRQGVKFHNGREMVADDVKFSTERVLKDPKGGSFSVNIISIDNVEVVDPNHIIVHMKNPDATTLTGLALIPIIPKEALDATGYMSTNPVGCGPFKFVSWEKGTKVVMEKFADFWEKDENGIQLPYLDGMEIISINEYAPFLSAFMSGDLDYITQADQSDIVSWKANPPKGIKFDDGGYSPYCGYFIAFNMVDGKFKDNENLRLAVKYALDSANLNEVVFKGLIPGSQITHIAKDSPYYNKEWEYSPDLTLAKEYLTKAGYPDGVTINGETAKNVPLEAFSLVVKEQLAKIGINYAVNAREIPQYVEKVTTFDFESWMSGSPTISDPGPFLENMMKTGGSWNLHRFSDPMVDDLLNRARAETDFNKRYALYDQIEKFRIEHALPYLVYTSGNLRFSAAQDYVQNFESQINAVFSWTRLWLDK